MSSRLLLKILNLPVIGTIENLAYFLKRHGIILSEKYSSAISKMVTDLNEFLTDENKNSKVIVYTYIAADIEQVWKEHGIDIYSKPIGWASKVMKPNAAQITIELEKRFDATLYELEKVLLSLKEDPSGKTSLYEANDDVADLKKRESVFADV